MLKSFKVTDPSVSQIHLRRELVTGPDRKSGTNHTLLLEEKRRGPASPGLRAAGMVREKELRTRPGSGCHFLQQPQAPSSAQPWAVNGGPSIAQCDPHREN